VNEDPHILLSVIPANAGIQFEYVVRSTQNRFIPSAAHRIFNWIPAFAGMTMWQTSTPG
jgi:hypothetical protein